MNPDQDVRNLSNSLDEVLKGIIHKSISFLIDKSESEEFRPAQGAQSININLFNSKRKTVLKEEK